MTTAFITGASGFLGTHLARILRAQGTRVRCLVRQSSRVDTLKSLGVELIYGDLRDPQGLSDAAIDADVVYHLAGLVKGLNYQELLAVNEQGVHHIARACASKSNPPVLVLASSLAAVGPSARDTERLETDPPQPVSYYGKSKLAGERAIRQWANRLPVSIVRPPIVFGEYDPNGLEMFRPIARQGIHPVMGFAQRMFSVIHAEDLAQALLLAGQRGRRLIPLKPNEPVDSNESSSEGVYFAADPQPISYADLGRKIGRSLKRKRTRVIRLPQWLCWCVAAGADSVARLRGEAAIFSLDKLREASAGSWVCSTQRAQVELGFKVVVPLEERLQQTVEWYLHQGWL